MSNPWRGRFAPSPTGRLHLGNARTALLAWLQARAAGGTFLLRIEDLDAARVRPGQVDTLLRDLEYLGLTWDEAPRYQSTRAEAYAAALERLDHAGRLYPCFCSRAEVARAASAPHGPDDDGPRYPGTCAHLSPLERAARGASRKPSRRFRCERGVTSFIDGVHGSYAQEVATAVGDFAVRRADGVASYQLAVVVDDADSAVTDVLRGDDLLGSTPRQIQIYRALGLEPPRFAHVPLVIGMDGKRLAKREGAYAIAELREAGVPAQRVLGLLATWSGLGRGEPVDAVELVDRFALDSIPREPTRTSEESIRSALI